MHSYIYCKYRYKTTVSFARGKVYIAIVRTETEILMHGGTLKQSQFWNTSSMLCYVNIFILSVYLNLSFVWSLESCGIFQKPECYMINVLKINCGLIPILSQQALLSWRYNVKIYFTTPYFDRL